MTGKVFLVGAGPGDPGLLTIRGLECLQHADVVVYDSLANPALLEHAPERAERIFVGERGRPGRKTQEEINAVLIDRSTGGRQVVRLKGGDPFVFGRGGEEAIALQLAGIAFEVVPGVSAAFAVPAYAGIPVTHRGVSSGFCVVTGREDPTKSDSDLDWQALATFPGTIVMLMGAVHAQRLAKRMLDAGMRPETPMAIVRWGTYPWQETHSGTLASMSDLSGDTSIEPPVVIVIGAVAGLRDQLRWYDTGPLFGKRVIVTRSADQSESLIDALREERAVPIAFPTITVVPLPPDRLSHALAQVAKASWVVFTSAKGVQAVTVGTPTGKALLRSARIAVVGTQTARAVESAGLQVSFVPSQSSGEGLGEELPDVEGRTILLLQAVNAHEDLARVLVRRGAKVLKAPVYETLSARNSPKEALDALARGDVDCVTFTSGSTVTRLVELLKTSGLDHERALRRPAIACIGPKTADSVNSIGLRAQIVAETQSVTGLIAAMKTYFGSSRAGEAVPLDSAQASPINSTEAQSTRVVKE